MPATTHTPRIGRQRGRFNGWLPGTPALSPPIAGPPPHAVLQDVTPNPTRQGSQHLSPLGFLRPGPADQQPRPSSPFGVNLRNLAATARGEDLDGATLRRLATLPEAEQGRLLGQLRAGGYGVTDATVNDSLDAYNQAALSPGSWTPDLADAYIRATSQAPTSQTVSADERREALRTLTEDHPAPDTQFTDREILDTVADARTDRARQEGFLYQGTQAPDYAPAEQFLEAEQEE